MKKMIALTSDCLTFQLRHMHMLWLERAQSAAAFGEYSEQQRNAARCLEVFNQATAFSLEKALVLKCNKIICFMRQRPEDVQLSHELIYGNPTQLSREIRQKNLKADSELDIVPAQPNSNTFTVMYQGKPADVKVTVYSHSTGLKIIRPTTRPN